MLKRGAVAVMAAQSSYPDFSRKTDGHRLRVDFSTAAGEQLFADKGVIVITVPITTGLSLREANDN